MHDESEWDTEQFSTTQTAVRCRFSLLITIIDEVELAKNLLIATTFWISSRLSDRRRSLRAHTGIIIIIIIVRPSPTSPHLSLECVSFSKVLNIFSKFISPIKKTFLTESTKTTTTSTHSRRESSLLLWAAKISFHCQQCNREESRVSTKLLLCVFFCFALLLLQFSSFCALLLIMIRLKDVMKFFSFSTQHVSWLFGFLCLLFFSLLSFLLTHLNFMWKIPLLPSFLHSVSLARWFVFRCFAKPLPGLSHPLSDAVFVWKV